jgi:hypothetical protein
MTDQRRLPAPPGDRIRAEPYKISLRTQYASPAWRAVAKPYYEAAKAWRAELCGHEGYYDTRRVVSFETWQRLRQGRPSTFAAYDAARAKALDAPTDHPEDVADKIALAAELLGVADPWLVNHPCDKTPEGGWTLADKMFGVLYRDACAVAKRAATTRGGKR